MSSLSRRIRSGLAVTGAVVGLIALSACTGGGSTPGATDQAASDTVTAGKLTIATGEPAYEPWVLGNDPASGKGFESAVAYAVADELGYAKGDVVWVRSTFDSAIAPGPKDWDINIQQFSANDERRKAVDFSSPYYVASQAVVAEKSSPAAKATTLDALKKVKLGTMTGTTSYTVAEKALGGDIQLFNNLTDATQALMNGQIDGLIADLPTAFYISGAELKDGTVVGQFADTTGGDELSLVLPKGSKLTDKVTTAVDTLRENGTLAEITTEWLSSEVDVPVFE